MNDILLKNILICIRDNQVFGTLLTKGYTYGQIGNSLVQAEIDGYIEIGTEGYIISSKGRDIIKNTIPYEPKKIREKYYRKDSIGIDEIYIPKYDGGKER